MSHVFVDTAAWIALISKRDALHHPARNVMNNLRLQHAQLTTTEFVLIEVANALSAPQSRLQAVRLIEGLRSLSTVQVIPASPELFAAALTLYRDRPDKEWSLTDCASFIIMQQERITQAFTSDHHFEQAGFSKLL
ncbi:MAG TPA: PIN domain-containing protein [Pyrinomonadaceae bacterium]